MLLEHILLIHVTDSPLSVFPEVYLFNIFVEELTFGFLNLLCFFLVLFFISVISVLIVFLFSLDLQSFIFLSWKISSFVFSVSKCAQKQFSCCCLTSITGIPPISTCSLLPQCFVMFPIVSSLTQGLFCCIILFPGFRMLLAVVILNDTQMWILQDFKLHLLRKLIPFYMNGESMPHYWGGIGKKG